MLLIPEVSAQRLVEVRDLGLCLDPITAVRLGNDVVLGLVEIVLVLDIADDLLQHILDGDQSGDSAIFVDDDGDMVAIGAEVAQQYVEALGFRHEDGRPQGVAKVEAFRIGVVVEQLLGQQDADHIVLVLANDRKARVPRLEHERDEAHGLVLDRHHVHLRARNHDVAHRHLGNLQRTFDDRQRVCVEELSLEGPVQQVEELLAILRLTRQKS